jgi:hypothetical protein
LLIFVILIALDVLVIIFALSKGLFIALALGEFALLGVWAVVFVVEGLIVIVALGTLLVIFALSILVVIVANGVLVAIFALGILVVIVALGVFVINIVHDGLVIIVVIVGNGRIIIIITLSEELVVTVVANGILFVVGGDVALLDVKVNESHFGTLNKPKTMELRSSNVPARLRVLSQPPFVMPTCFRLVVACKISNSSHLRPNFIFYLFYVLICCPQQRDKTPPYNLPWPPASPPSLPLPTPTIN